MNQDVDYQLGGLSFDELMEHHAIEVNELLYGDDAPRGQSKKMSLTETLLNTFSGMVISTVAQVLIYPLFGIHVPLSTNMALCAIFTVISIVRSYFWRRLFNKLHEKGISL